MKNTIIIAGLLLGASTSITTQAAPGDIVIIDDSRIDDGGECGAVEEAAGCDTVTIWIFDPPVTFCRCPWEWSPAPAPCAPGEGDCSE